MLFLACFLPFIRSACLYSVILLSCLLLTVFYHDLTCVISFSIIQHLTSRESKVGPLIVKEPPPLPKPRKVPELVPQEVPEPEPRRILTHKRSVQAVTALAITVGVLLLAVIVLVVVRLKTNTKGRPTYIY